MFEVQYTILYLIEEPHLSVYEGLTSAGKASIRNSLVGTAHNVLLQMRCYTYSALPAQTFLEGQADVLLAGAATPGNNWVIDTPELGREHVWKNGAWVCDHTYPLHLNASHHEPVASYGAANVTASFYLIISIPGM